MILIAFLKFLRQNEFFDHFEKIRIKNKIKIKKRVDLAKRKHIGTLQHHASFLDMDYTKDIRKIFGERGKNK